MNRRSFLQRSAATLAALGVPRPVTAGSPVPHLDRIGVQLYTVRDALQRDFEGTLARVAAVGYREVETAGYADRTGAQVRDALRRAGLSAPSAHVSLESLESGWDQVLADARTVGHRYLVIPWLDENDRTSLDAYRRIAHRLNRAGEAAKRAGLRLAYHNHDFEFQAMDERLPYDVLLESTDPAHVAFELDLYWITKGGQDPLTYFARWPGRFPLVHVKDSAGPPEHRMADVGAGTIDWKRIFARRGEAGIEHFFVERDDAPDPPASIEASYRYLRRLALLALLAMVLLARPLVLEAQQWPVHDMDRPSPPVVDPGSAGRPPSDAVVLFGGKDLSRWKAKDGGPAAWKVEQGYFEVVAGRGDLVSVPAFGDCQLHLEWAAPAPAKGEGQERGNSGVFLMGRYEVQILDSYRSRTYADGQSGAVYGQFPPQVNASRPPGEWQEYDIVFHRPRFDRDGKLQRPARMTVLHNGVLVQDDVELTGATAHGVRARYEPHADRLPLLLQDHGHPVRYRNVWVRELPDHRPAEPSQP